MTARHLAGPVLPGRHRPARSQQRRPRILLLIALLALTGTAVATATAAAGEGTATAQDTVIFVEVNPSSVPAGDEVGLRASCDDNLRPATVASEAFGALDLRPEAGFLTRTVRVPPAAPPGDHLVSLRCADGDTARTTLHVLTKDTPGCPATCPPPPPTCPAACPTPSCPTDCLPPTTAPPCPQDCEPSTPPPTDEPTPEPTEEPTEEPTPEPTEEPTPEPTTTTTPPPTSNGLRMPFPGTGE